MDQQERIKIMSRETLPFTPTTYRRFYDKVLAECGEDAYFTFFEGGDNADGYFERARWTWETFFAKHLQPLLPPDRRKLIVEIGCGGGGVTLSAARDFKEVVAFDVHNQTALVQNELHNRGATNVRVYQNGGRRLSTVVDHEADAVISWAVLLHAGLIDVVEGYVKEAARVLRPGGVCMLYLARLARRKIATIDEWRASNEAEKQNAVGHNSRADGQPTRYLRVAVWYADKLLTEAGFKTLYTVPTGRVVPGFPFVFGGQHATIAVKQ